jgi:hypothetical protein
VYQKAASGVGSQEALDTQAPSKRADDWSNDGRYIPTNLDRARQNDAPHSG